MSHLHPRRLLAEQGFTMIVALGVMLVTSLLLVAAFTIANGEVALTRDNTTQKQAYYAALAGIQEYEYKLQAEPDYWQSCKTVEGSIVEESSGKTVTTPAESYVATPIVSQSGYEKSYKSCNTENSFASMIQASGRFANTFRVKSVGTVKTSSTHTATRTVIATFGVTGFLDYVYYTNYETVDPGIYVNSSEPRGNKACEGKECANGKALAADCEGKYYSEWSAKKTECEVINWGSGDEVEGPMHTNDTALVSGTATFGRSGHEPKDIVEMYGGTYGTNSGCKGATYNTASGCYIEKGKSTKVPLGGAEILTPPPNDESLAQYVEPENEYEGMIHLELKGKEIAVTYYNTTTAKYATKTVAWPKNGLLYVKGSSTNACGITNWEVDNSDTSSEETNEKYCGDVYVNGNYEKSLTVAGTADVIVNGNLYPTGTKLASAGSSATKPTGSAVLGLIAGEYVRVYHPCTSSNGNGGTSLSGPWIYAGILATTHSWLVDNSNCGSPLGKLNVYGAIAQDYRGVVGTVGGNGQIATGYSKNYEYDERLATDEPPYFLAPLKAGWKIIREAAPTAG